MGSYIKCCFHSILYHRPTLGTSKFHLSFGINQLYLDHFFIGEISGRKDGQMEICGALWRRCRHSINRDRKLKMIHKIEFKSGRGLTLRGFVSVPKQYKTAIVFLHGFPSHIRGFSASHYLKIMEKLPYLFLTFDFSHTDTSDGKFEDKLMSKEVADIKYAIDFLEKNYPFRNLILVGHSTGAIDAALYAHRDTRITKLILTGAVSDLKNAAHYDFTDGQVRDFWTKGYIKYDRPDKWVHGKKIKKAFYDEFFTLDIPAAIKKYQRPLLIVHGEKDSIPVSEPQALCKMANRPKKLVIIRGADHSFTKKEHFRKVLKVMKRFIEK